MGTDINFSNLLTDRLFHAIKSILDVFDIHDMIRICFHRDHHKITVIFVTVTQMMHIFIDFSEFAIIKIKYTRVVTIFT